MCPILPSPFPLTSQDSKVSYFINVLNNLKTKTNVIFSHFIILTNH